MVVRQSSVYSISSGKGGDIAEVHQTSSSTSSSCSSDLDSTENQIENKTPKSANRLLRWNLLFTLFILSAITSSIWIAFIPVVNRYALIFVLACMSILQIVWFIGLFNAIRYTLRLRRYRSRRVDTENQSNCSKIKHLVGICVYKEPIQLLIDTIDSVASQSNCSKKISLFIGFEEGTPERDQIVKQLEEKYTASFERLLFVVHPRGLEGDIPGKCSNLNYAARTAVSKLRQDQYYCMATQLLVTTGDCDSIFGERYFDALEEEYWKTSEKERKYTVWQSPLFYTMKTKTPPFFVRVTGLLRSFFMIGFLIPWNINTMSIFSLTLELFEKGGYTHPGYQMEDIIAVIRWSLAVRKQCKIQAIPVATLSGPTSGDGYINELYEWARQIRRWTIGAGEVFHYFAIKSFRLPTTVSLVFAVRFIFYYGVVLCVSSLFSLTAPFITSSILTARDVDTVLSTRNFTYISLGFLLLQYLCFLAVFLINSCCSRVFPQGIRDNCNFIINIVHFLLTLPTIILYSLVELAAFLELTVRGKDVCSHSASKKDGLILNAQVQRV